LDLKSPVDDVKGRIGTDKWLLCFTKVAHIIIPCPKHTNNQGAPPDSDILSDGLKGGTRSRRMPRLPHEGSGDTMADARDNDRCFHAVLLAVSQESPCDGVDGLAKGAD
jgi:hypothetical protein